MDRGLADLVNEADEAVPVTGRDAYPAGPHPGSPPPPPGVPWAAGHGPAA